MSFNRDTLTQEELAALKIIRGHRALISMVCDFSIVGDERVYDNGELDSVLSQLANPSLNRPSRSAELFASHHLPRPPKLLKTNLKTGEEHEHIPGECRNTRHKGVEYQHTAKNPSSLIPSEPEHMHCIGYDLIGFLWDIDACNLHKEKYVFATDGGTDLCWWLSPNPYHPEPDDWMPVTTVAELRAQNDKAVAEKNTIAWNELLVGWPKGRIDAMFAPRDELSIRLRVLKASQRAKEILKFEKDIPLFIIQSDCQDGNGAVFRVYTKAEQEADLKAAAEKESQVQLSPAAISPYSFFTPAMPSIVPPPHHHDDSIARSRQVRKPLNTLI
jgi:hypothetical protein